MAEDMSDAINSLETATENIITAPDGILPLEQVAEILGVPDVAKYIEAFNTDIKRWKAESDNLYYSRMASATFKLGEVAVLNVDGENDNYWSGNDKVYDGIIKIMETNRADYKAMGEALEKGAKAYRKALALKINNQLYAKLMKDKENLYLARQAIDFYYTECVNRVQDSIIEDNAKMSDTLKKLVGLSDEVKKAVENYGGKKDENQK